MKDDEPVLKLEPVTAHYSQLLGRAQGSIRTDGCSHFLGEPVAYPSFKERCGLLRSDRFFLLSSPRTPGTKTHYTDRPPPCQAFFPARLEPWGRPGPLRPDPSDPARNRPLDHHPDEPALPDLDGVLPRGQDVVHRAHAH